MSNNTPHNPVLLNEVLINLNPKDKGVYIDATFGAGGYTKAILNAAKCHVYALDQDPDALKYAQEIKHTFQDRFDFIQGNFGDMEQLIKNHQGYGTHIDGIVFDIGVSSMQLAEAARGFSFMNDGPLDMRMNTNNPITAATIVNEYSEKDLADIFFRYGGEKKSRRIAKGIIHARQSKDIETTAELATIITRATGHYNDTIHPATRTFQALRIVVNDELRQLQNGLVGARNLISPNGSIVVVTFHSLEDAIVKKYFNELAGRTPRVNKYLPAPFTELKSCNFMLPHRKAISPTYEEIKANPRARSAKLRTIRRISND